MTKQFFYNCDQLLIRLLDLIRQVRRKPPTQEGIRAEITGLTKCGALRGSTLYQ